MWQLMRGVAGNMCQRQCTLTYIQSEAFLNNMEMEKVAFWIRYSLARLISLDPQAWFIWFVRSERC